ncbi:protein S-acyltransferase 18 [Pyrus ussuriensis x Pyrus communis]|uniref:Protein S-acyltransferase 18 n=1 Tax=Pyrus ussuriensis x Pyrus communis TaxID=2448454 RepID=A0A5N5GEM3_9ROSA|nr:protein S-acyltransferase 18 [Pyrus ussuriensis x Pyrus communis]
MPWLVTPLPSLHSLVVVFYTFLGFFLGNRILEITAVSVMFLLIRCTATDPTDRTSLKKKNKKKPQVSFFRRVERKILRTFIRRRYLNPWKTVAQLDPLLPFPFVLIKEEAVSPNLRDDISFCALCEKTRQALQTCNRCVDTFDHYCRNYTTFILLMIFLLLLSKDKASIAAEKAREQVVKQKQPTEEDSLKPLLLETKCGPLMTSTDKGTTTTVGSGLTLLISKGWMPGSPGGKFSSPRRWVPSSLTMFSGIVPSPKHKYRNNFDLKFMEVSRKLETYISRQVLCSVTQKEGSEASPR